MQKEQPHKGGIEHDASYRLASRARTRAKGTGSGTSSGPSQANSRHRSESGFLLDLKPIDPTAASQPGGIIVYSPGRADGEPAQPGGDGVGMHVPFVNL